MALELRLRLVLTGALALVSPAVALAQPAPHHVVGQVIDVTGEVSVPAGGGPMITVNKSNGFQVGNEPFRTILAGCSGRRVEVSLRMKQPGPFGGRVDALWVLARPRTDVTIRAGASALAPTIVKLAAGRALRIVGATLRYYRVQLQDGRRGYLSRHAAVSIGEAKPTAAPGPGLVGGLSAAALEQLRSDWETALIDGTAPDASAASIPAAARARRSTWQAEGRDTKVHQLAGPAGQHTYAVVAEAPAGAVDFELLVRVYDAQGALLARGHAGDSPQIYWD